MHRASGPMLPLTALVAGVEQGGQASKEKHHFLSLSFGNSSRDLPLRQRHWLVLSCLQLSGSDPHCMQKSPAHSMRRAR